MVALISPIQGPYTETQGFHGHTGGHPGVDLAAPIGTPVVAPAGGTITIAGYDTGGFGNWIVEKLSNGWSAVFGHLSAENVHAGDVVAQGQRIGAVGSTGESTGPHLHYQLETGGPPPVPSANLIDPQPYLAQAGAFAQPSAPSVPGPATGGGVPDATAVPDATLTSATGVATGWPAGQLTLIPSSPLFGGVHIAKSTLFRTALMIVGLLILLIAINAIAKGRADEGPITLVGNAARRTRQDAGDASDSPSSVPGVNSASARLASDREATQRWELLNRQHKAQSAIVERTKRSRAQDETDADVAHAEAASRAQGSDEGYQANAAAFRRNAAARKRATGGRVRHVAEKGAEGAAVA